MWITPKETSVAHVANAIKDTLETASLVLKKVNIIINNDRIFDINFKYYKSKIYINLLQGIQGVNLV